MQLADSEFYFPKTNQINTGQVAELMEDGLADLSDFKEMGLNKIASKMHFSNLKIKQDGF